ncbi:metal-sulfur cluster assembly factor [Candidatus Micrarchaeota archaeon]|nr:metal-sulfur cluster assembly factor [Candidatus Micrarchaeota archaeon]
MADKEDVMGALSEVMDPELGISVVDLGLIYGVNVHKGKAEVRMTFTTPACPMLNLIVSKVEEAVNRVGGISEVSVKLVWDPPWSPQRISEAGKRALGFGK